jgi:hypothetical protein
MRYDAGMRKLRKGRPPVPRNEYRLPITIRLPRELRGAFGARCEQEGESQGRIMERLVRAYLARRRKER